MGTYASITAGAVHVSTLPPRSNTKCTRKEAPYNALDTGPRMYSGWSLGTAEVAPSRDGHQCSCTRRRQPWRQQAPPWTRKHTQLVSAHGLFMHERCSCRQAAQPRTAAAKCGVSTPVHAPRCTRGPTHQDRAQTVPHGTHSLNASCRAVGGFAELPRLARRRSRRGAESATLHSPQSTSHGAAGAAHKKIWLK